MRKNFKAIVAAVLVIAMFSACNGTNKDQTSGGAGGTGDKPYIAVISKGFQHQFWQTVMKGSNDAAEKYNVEITFEGPPSESDISNQVDMVKAAMAKKPAALCLAALDTESVIPQLNDCISQKIPVIGFDSGVPNAPAGAIYSTASTNNYEAGKLAANEMFKQADISAKLKSASAAAPVTIAVHSQDATSASIKDRTNGFIDGMLELAGGVQPGAVEVVGHDVFKKASANPAAVTLSVTIPPSTSNADAQVASQAMLQNSENLIGYFCSNESSVNGILAATNDGTDLDRTNGKYKDLIVVGFDAGVTQKNAVKNNYFYGSVTQDPYQIGYLAVELAYKAINGEKIEEIVDTGCKFYTSANMDADDISILLYD